MDDDDFAIIECMEKYGGSFVKALAQCFLHADPNNFRKLKGAFNEYWEEYRKMANERCK